MEPWAGGSGTVTTEPWLVPALVVPTMLTATNGESDDQNEPYRETDLSVAVTTS